MPQLHYPAMGHQLHEKLPFSVATVFPNKRIPSRNIIPQYVQPYVGLMRLEKVDFSLHTFRRVANDTHQPTGTFLIFWPFGELPKSRQLCIQEY